eukprot:COSAG04_NODE_2129_length_4736_cov_3.960319_1_plen_1220_part_00
MFKKTGDTAAEAAVPAQEAAVRAPEEVAEDPLRDVRSTAAQCRHLNRRRLNRRRLRAATGAQECERRRAEDALGLGAHWPVSQYLGTTSEPEPDISEGTPPVSNVKLRQATDEPDEEERDQLKKLVDELTHKLERLEQTEKEKQEAAIPRISLSGATGSCAAAVNGEYRRTAETCDGAAVYEKVGDAGDAGDLIWYHAELKMWMVGERESLGSNTCFSSVNSTSAVPPSRGTDGARWKLWSGKEWEEQDLTVEAQTADAVIAAAEAARREVERAAAKERDALTKQVEELKRQRDEAVEARAATERNVARAEKEEAESRRRAEAEGRRVRALEVVAHEELEKERQAAETERREAESRAERLETEKAAAEKQKGQAESKAQRAERERRQERERRLTAQQAQQRECLQTARAEEAQYQANQRATAEAERAERAEREKKKAAGEAATEKQRAEQAEKERQEEHWRKLQAERRAQEAEATRAAAEEGLEKERQGKRQAESKAERAEHEKQEAAEKAAVQEAARIAADREAGQEGQRRRLAERKARQAEREKQEAAIPRISLSGATGRNAAAINGDYRRTGEKCGGSAVYEKLGDADKLIWYQADTWNAWRVGARENLGTGRSCAFVQSRSRAPMSRGTGGARWQVWSGEEWEEQDVVVEAQEAEAAIAAAESRAQRAETETRANQRRATRLEKEKAEAEKQKGRAESKAQRAEREKQEAAIPRISLAGATGSNAADINGEYRRTDETCDGFAVYEKVGDPDTRAWYYQTNHTWTVGPRENLGTGTSFAFVQSRLQAPTSRGTGGTRWQVWSGRAWEEQDLVVEGQEAEAAARQAAEAELQKAESKAARAEREKAQAESKAARAEREKAEAERQKRKAETKAEQAEREKQEAVQAAGVHFVWECNVGRGNYVEYDPEISTRLEQCREAGTCCDLQIGSERYRVDFQADPPQHQVNVKTGWKREIRRELRARAGVVTLPPEWTIPDGNHWQLVDDAAWIPEVQGWMEASIQPGHPGGMTNVRVHRVHRVENRQLWEQYQRKLRFIGGQMDKTAPEMLRDKARIPDPDPAASHPRDMLDGRVLEAHNEFLLWHGTKPDTAPTLAQWGFDERVARDSGLYGAGNYFADACSKSHQYRGTRSSGYADSTNADGHHCMLLCRVAMGSPFLTNARHTGERRPPDNPQTPGAPHDSIFAETGVANGGAQLHNEYVVFSQDQVYPELLIYYTV